MFVLSEYFFLAGSNRDTEGWINILFMVALAIFWSLGNIIKSKVKQKGRQQQLNNKKNITQRPSRAASSAVGEKSLLFGKYKSSESASRTANSNRNIDISHKRLIKKSEFKRLREKFVDKNTLAKGINPDLEAIGKIEQQFNKLQDLSEGLSKIAPDKGIDDSGGIYADNIYNFSMQDELRKAIIYSEILGKPKALKETSEPYFSNININDYMPESPEDTDEIQ